MISGRHADPFELAPVELDAGAAKQLLRNQIADEIADGEAVRLGRLVNRVGRHQAAGARDVIHQHRRIAGNILGNMPTDHPRISIEAAAGRKADEDADGFAGVEFLRVGGPRKTVERHQGEYEYADADFFPGHVIALLWINLNSPQLAGTGRERGHYSDHDL